MIHSDIVSFEMLAAWPVLVIVLMWLDRRHGNAPLFLVYAYIAGLAVNHWFGGLVHSFPWKPFVDSANTVAGFNETTLGLACLVAGAAAVPKLKSNSASGRAMSSSGNRGMSDDIGKRIATILLTTGALSWVLEMTPVAQLPSMAAILSGGKQMLIAGMCMKCWIAWQLKDMSGLYRWVALSFAFPVYTVVAMGFLGFGMMFMMTIMIFIGTFYRPRWHVFAGAFVAVFAALSVYVTYMEHRNNIRSSVWGGQALEQRLDVFSKMLSEVGPFDFGNPRHLETIDGRLNQNELVGKGINYVPDFRSWANGETIYMALLALVPRAIWPDKPVIAGGMGLVALYTGMEFTVGTSVGIGQPLEFYVNFGHVGVIAGFLIFGFVLRYIDLRLSMSIQYRMWDDVGMWFAVGASMLQPIGQLVEISAAMGAAALVGMLINRYARKLPVEQQVVRGRGARR